MMKKCLQLSASCGKIGFDVQKAKRNKWRYK